MLRDLKNHWRMCLAVAVALAASVSSATPQQIKYLRGQNIFPVFEGWMPNSDGSYDMLFGYMNRNYEEILDIPVGPNNSIDPNGPDHGQPTHFFPRRSRFTFRVRVPKDFGTKELVWSLTIRGKTERAYATLRPEYILDHDIMMNNTGNFGVGLRPEETSNKAPVVRIDGDLSRTARVGEKLRLAAFVNDDGIPALRTSARSADVRRATAAASSLLVSWTVYRGAGNVLFDPPHARADVTTQGRFDSMATAKGNVAPAPLRASPDGTVVVNATFAEPGVYVLQLMAFDGGLATTENVTITVGPK